MQFHHDNAKIHTMFNGIIPNRKLVIIPNITTDEDNGWGLHYLPYWFDRFDGTKAMHLTIVEIYTSYPANQSLENPINAPDTYNVICKLHDFAGSLDYDYIMLDVYFIHQDNIWTFSLQLLPEGLDYNYFWISPDVLEGNFTESFYTPLEDYAIHDIVMIADENSIPTMCANACKKRTARIEKNTFSAVLARRFGDILANDLAHIMFPEIDKCTSKHSLLNYV